jgi:PAS domain-containing protein
MTGELNIHACLNHLIGYVVLDPEGRIITMNDAFLKRIGGFGYSPEKSDRSSVNHGRMRLWPFQEMLIFWAWTGSTESFSAEIFLKGSGS